jgi:signal transduction histidine kinase
MLSELLDDVVGLQERQLHTSHIRLQKKYFTPGLVHGFPVELRQVFLNLIGNAIQAMPNGGDLRLSVRETYDWHLMRRGISVSIVDTGAGINPQDSGKLFEPFFSTKSTKGTGLGLWISKGIIQKYEGRISFRSFRTERGCSTCFRVFLPSSPSLNLIGNSATESSSSGIDVSANGYGAAMQHA